MVEVPCPKCNNPNPSDAQVCQFCGAELTPPAAGSIRPGVGPVKKVTSELERVSTPGGKTPIKPGEVPTKKDTGELERALPTWLQSLRKGESQEPTGPAPEANQPDTPGDSTPPATAPGELPDWLSGLKSEEEENEEVPDWLAGIRKKMGTEEPAQPAEEIPSQPQEELMSRLGEPAEEIPSQPQEGLMSHLGESAEEESTPADELSDWLSELKSGSTLSTPEGGSALPAEEAGDLPAGLHGTSPEVELPADTGSSEPEWMARLKEETTKPESSPGAAPAEMPDWLSGIPAEPSAPESESTDSSISSEIPDWLKLPQAEAEPPAEKPAAQPFETGSVPSAGGEEPDWLSRLQAETVQESSTPAVQPDSESMKDEIPAEPIPAWLSGVKETDASTGGPPALIQDVEAAAGRGEAAGMFSMEEQPDWLSTLKPEEGEKAAAPESAGEELSDSLEKAELPSWVQAMRPVEAVVADIKPPPLVQDRPTEQGGPLAGLRGVLPAVPGLGPLRKPPAYSIKLQVGDSQQQHASRLERIITNEAEPQAIRNKAHLYSARLMRWIIALIFFLVIGVSIATGGQVVPAGALYPPEMIAAMDVIGGLGSNSPVLVIFDYQPALFGEMEAAAAPMIDSLLFKGARLTFLSTSPTGPALAERFMLNTQAEHNYQSGQQYVNLGYLPGGPAGMLNFVQNPTVALPYSVDGQSAWQMPPLQGVQQFSDYAAVILLIDDPDTGRTWIEQTGTLLEQPPMLMVISAQAEPMIRPYYDSGQIKGLVTGLAGGKAYEYAIQRPGPGGKYWNAFSIGMLAAEIMIVLGATWSTFAAWRDRRAIKEGKA